MEAGAGHRTRRHDAPAGLERERIAGGMVVFHTLGMLSGVPVVTADGEKRPIQGFLFDDRSWLVRYLVVEAGNWLAPQTVVLSTAAVNVPDWKAKRVRTQLTLQQVLGSPPAETVRPVSRQQELAWSRHFGWPDEEARWHFPAIAAQWEFEGGAADDPHLRRAGDLKGYEVWGPQGALGQLQGYLVGDRSWHIAYLAVRARQWAHGEQVISTRRVCGISWGEHRVWLEGALNAPRNCEEARPGGLPPV